MGEVALATPRLLGVRCSPPFGATAWACSRARVVEREGCAIGRPCFHSWRWSPDHVAARPLQMCLPTARHLDAYAGTGVCGLNSNYLGVCAPWPTKGLDVCGDMGRLQKSNAVVAAQRDSERRSRKLSITKPQTLAASECSTSGGWKPQTQQQWQMGDNWTIAWLCTVGSPGSHSDTRRKSKGSGVCWWEIGTH